jgi:hypothetical protein
MSRGKMKKWNSIAQTVGFFVCMTGLLLFNLNHATAFWVELIGGVILFLSTIQAGIEQVYINFEDDFGLSPSIRSMMPKVVLTLQRQKGRKRISADGLCRFKESIRGRQFPIAIQFGCHDATVIVDCCFDGVPKLVSLRGRFPLNELDTATDPRGSLLKS